MQAAASDPGDRADRLLAAGRLDEDAATRIADALVLRHARAGRAPERSPDGATLERALRTTIASVVHDAPQLETSELREVEERQAEFLETHADRLLARAGRNRVLELAVALRLADVALCDRGEAQIVTRDEGQPGDVCVELAGLSVELRASDHTGLAERLICHYAGQADDFDLYEVVDYHECACALERAAEGAHRVRAAIDTESRQRALQETCRLVSLALAARRRKPLPPFLVAVGGQVASGKSTLARLLADRMAAPLIISDRVRDQLLHGVPGREIHGTHWAESFAPGFHERIYSELLERADCALRSGRAVVLDACFPRTRDRGAARSLARRRGVPFRFVECRIDRKTQRARLAKREETSDHGGWEQIAMAYGSRWEPPDELSEEELVVLDTARPPAESAARLDTRFPTWPGAVRA
jgi:predicted kinase